MRHVNWESVKENDGSFQSPVPGGYVAMITNVIDNEEKEYLRIEWEFAEGDYVGENRRTYDRAGFWPTSIIRSYKESALGYFKAFKTAVEKSNPRYIFDDRNPVGLVGKYIGVVLGEKEYEKKNGDIGTKLEVSQTRSVDSIRKGDYTIPKPKKLTSRSTQSTNVIPFSTPTRGFSEIDDDEEGDLPF